MLIGRVQAPPHKHKTKIVFDCFSVSLVWGKGVELGGQGLSRYYSDLLLGFQPALFLYGIGSTALTALSMRLAVRIPKR